MKVTARILRSATHSWERMVEEASEFASSIGRDALINISVSAPPSGEGVIVVWYWEKE